MIVQEFIELDSKEYFKFKKQLNIIFHDKVKTKIFEAGK